MQPKTSWGFTDRPDFPRVCRELEQVGAIVGRVTMKGEAPVTLVDMHSNASRNVIRSNVRHAYVTGTNRRWVVLAGDVVRQIMGVAPVTVEAFGPAQLMAVDMETAAPQPGAVAPPEPVFLWGIFDGFGKRSVTHPQAFESEAAARDYLDQKVLSFYMRRAYTVRALPGRPVIRSVQKDPEPPPAPPKKWGLFLYLDQSRSQDYPGEYSSQAAAMALVPFARKSKYYAKELVLGA
jgi:hypothetical protein